MPTRWVIPFFAHAGILSIGAVLLFLGVLTAPGRIFEHPAAQPFIQTLGLNVPEQLLLPVTIAFGVAAILVGAIRLLMHASIIFLLRPITQPK